MRCIFTHDPSMTKSLTLGGDTGTSTSTWTSISFSSKNKTSKTDLGTGRPHLANIPININATAWSKSSATIPIKTSSRLCLFIMAYPARQAHRSLSTTPTMAMSQNRATSLLFTLILKILHNSNLPVGLTYDLIVCGGVPYRPDVLDSM